jgi:hypothetical protein
LARCAFGLQEEGDEAADEAVEEARLGEREAGWRVLAWIEALNTAPMPAPAPAAPPPAPTPSAIARPASWLCLMIGSATPNSGWIALNRCRNCIAR